MKKIHIFRIFLFLSVLFIFSIGSIFYKSDVDFIESEQRERATFSETNNLFSDLIENKFIPEYENYYNDNFFQREKILKAKTILDYKVVKYNKISDVMISQDRTKAFRFRDGTDKIDNEMFTKGMSRWREIKQYLDKVDTKLLVVGIPDQSHVFMEEYPKYSNNDSERYKTLRSKFFNVLEDLGIDYIDVQDMLKSNKENYYTKTDHHHNFELTMEIYNHIVEKYKMKNIIDDSVLVTSDKKFIGSHNRKMFNLLEEDYKMQYLKSNDKINYSRYENGKLSKIPIFTDEEYYSSYMGGDKPHTVIDTKRDNLPNILVLGDSTSNSLETILWMNSNKLTSLDFRHYKKQNLTEYLEKHPQDLIVVSVISGNYDNLLSIMK